MTDVDPFQEKCKEFFKQIEPQNQQGNKSSSLDKRLGIQLRDQQGQGHGSEIDQERHRRNGNHGVYKIITVHFDDGGNGAWNVNIQDHAHPADAKALGHIFQVLVEFIQRVISKKIR